MAVKMIRHYCTDCAQLVHVEDSYHPIQTHVLMEMHWFANPHPRLSVVKSKDSGNWLVKRDELILRSCRSWKLAYFIAFERHPWTVRERKHQAIDNVVSKGEN